MRSETIRNELKWLTRSSKTGKPQSHQAIDLPADKKETRLAMETRTDRLRTLTKYIWSLGAKASTSIQV